MAHLSPSVIIGGGILYAGVVKLADTLDLGSNAERCAGSSPVTRTSARRVHHSIPLPFNGQGFSFVLALGVSFR